MSLIDKQQIDAMSGGEAELLLPILEDFVSSAESLISEATKDIEADQSKKAASVLHQLKGSGGTLGLSAFYEACIVAEKDCILGGDPDLAGLRELLSASVAEATAHLSPK